MRAAQRTLAATLLAALVAALLGTAPAAAQSGSVYVVGDSLQVGTGPYMAGYLPGLAVRVDADESRSSGAAVEVIRERTRPSDSVVVFDVGSNNDPGQPEALAADLAEVGGLIGDRCMVVVTLTRPPFNGVSFAGLNSVLTSFAAQRPNTELADWSSYAAAQPGLLYADRVHATSSGYDLRARLIADGVQSCLSGSALPPAAQAEPEALYEPAAVLRLQRALRQRATAARLLGMRYLEAIWDLVEAPGPGAAAALIGFTLFAPQRAGPANRSAGAAPGSRPRSPPRHSR